SQEYHKIVLDRLYGSYLHRAGDAGGEAGWLNALQTGALSQAQVAIALLASDEYFALAQQGRAATAEMTDEELRQRARELNRLLFPQDVRFKAMAEDWQRRGRTFSGLLFGNQPGATVGTYVKDLELMRKGCELPGG